MVIDPTPHGLRRPLGIYIAPIELHNARTQH